jgi:isocitrate lyase
MMVRYATADNLTASIEIKDFIGKGHSPQQWLSAEIDGGDRRQKASEKALISAGVMNPGQFWTPNIAPNPPAGLLDAYGNVPGSTIVQIMSRLGAFGEQGYKANMTERTRKRLIKRGMLVARNQRTMSDYFVYRKDGVPHAIMQLVAKGDARVVLWLTSDQPRYSPRFKFDDLVLSFVEKNFKPEMARCLEHALSTAR